MRGDDRQERALFSYVVPEARIPTDQPLRALRPMVDAVLQELPAAVAALYARTGRPSIPPERPLRALLLQILYTVRSERLLMEQLDYNILFRWFVGLNLDDPVWDPTVFSKNRDRLLAGEIAQARGRGLLSDEHFTVDGTLIEAWAGQKSFQGKAGGRTPPPTDPGNPTASFRGERRSKATDASTTDPGARLGKKAPGQAAKLAYLGHALMDNRHGLAVAAQVTVAMGTAEREAALELVRPARRRTLGAGEGYGTREFVAKLRALGITPHVAQNTSGRASAIDGRTTRHPGYAISQRKRKCVEASSGGSKLSWASGRRGIGGSPGSTGCSPWPWAPTIWPECGRLRWRPPESRPSPRQGFGDHDGGSAEADPEAGI